MKEGSKGTVWEKALNWKTGNLISSSTQPLSKFLPFFQRAGGKTRCSYIWTICISVMGGGREEREERWKKRRSERARSQPRKKFMLGLTLELHLDSSCEPMFPSRTLAPSQWWGLKLVQFEREPYLTKLSQGVNMEFWALPWNISSSDSGWNPTWPQSYALGRGRPLRESCAPFLKTDVSSYDFRLRFSQLIKLTRASGLVLYIHHYWEQDGLFSALFCHFPALSNFAHWGPISRYVPGTATSFCSTDTVSFTTHDRTMT